MKQSSKWLILPPYTFVDHINASKLFLYNTKTSSEQVITDDETISLIKELQMPSNLGSIMFYDGYNYNDNLKQLILQELLQIVDIKEKPFVLLPILNLQRDLEKGDLDSRLNLIGSKTKFISGIFILRDLPFISKSENINNIRINAIKQSMLYGLKEDCASTMALEKIEAIFKSLSITSVSIVDIISNISLWTDVEASWFSRMSSKYGYKIRVHSFIDNTLGDRILKIISENKNIEFALYFDRYSDFEYQSYVAYISEISTATSIFKYIYSDSDLVNSDKIDLIPIYTANNIQMFRDNVFLTKQDILRNGMSMKRIMRNQKLNANCFGILDILSNGEVYPHGGCIPVGNISEKNYLLKSVTNEFSNNQSWRVTRNRTICASCQYRFICPPVSLFELQIHDFKICLL